MSLATSPSTAVCAVSATSTVATSAPHTPRTRRLRLLVLTLLVGLLAPLVSVASPAEARRSYPVRTATEVHIDWYILRLINAERAAHQLPAVRMNWTLRKSARRHNVTMSRFNTMSHQLPGEAEFSRRMSAAGYKWSWAGENIAWNSSMTTAGVAVLQNLMYNELPPFNGHRLNILNRQFRDVGVDVYMDRAHHKVWLTTDFGRH